MRQITIRDIDPEVEQKIRSIAKGEGKSLNQIIKEIIHKEFKKTQRPTSSLKELAGTWTQEEAAEFEQSIKACEQVDEEMWQ
jgi:plasmid stability protein